LVVISIETGQVKSVYRPTKGKFLGDVELHFNADKLLFTSRTDQGELKRIPNVKAGSGFAVYELKIDPITGSARGEPRRLTPDMGGDVDNYDACYLPNGRVIFASTAA
jgi:hypothetical protein